MTNQRGGETLPDKIRKGNTMENTETYTKQNAFFEAIEHTDKEFTSGAVKAYRAWKNSETSAVELREGLWDSEIHDFVETMRKAGIDWFIFTNQSTALMENLHALAAEGCTVCGLAAIIKDGWPYQRRIKGIKIKL